MKNNLSDMIRFIVEDLKRSIPAEPNTPVHIPGEYTDMLRKEIQNRGVHIDPVVWAEILHLP